MFFFIVYDDFDWLLLGFDQGFEILFSKVGLEGCWGNVIWVKFSYFLSIKVVFGLYLVIFFVMCVFMFWVL